MKKLMIIIGIIILANVNAQIIESVKWSTSVIKISDTEAELVATTPMINGACTRNWPLKTNQYQQLLCLQEIVITLKKGVLKK